MARLTKEEFERLAEIFLAIRQLAEALPNEAERLVRTIMSDEEIATLIKKLKQTYR